MLTEQEISAWVATDPLVQGFLAYHAEREGAPRVACAVCQFEISQHPDEPAHVCVGF